MAGGRRVASCAGIDEDSGGTLGMLGDASYSVSARASGQAVDADDESGSGHIRCHPVHSPTIGSNNLSCYSYRKTGGRNI